MAHAGRYAVLLRTAGLSRGLLGPREADRLWERHLCNSAVLSELLPIGARVVDVGSGAGLPGLPVAICRPDVRVDLVESLRRRIEFLHEAVTELGLTDRVQVIHGRAEDREVRDAVGNSDWVTARAVAPLDRLARWCLPLLRTGGSLLAVKGDRAVEEIDTYRTDVARAGGSCVRVVHCGTELLDPPVTVVQVRRQGRSPGSRERDTDRRRRTKRRPGAHSSATGQEGRV